MARSKYSSIKEKLIRISMLVSASVLLLASMAFIIYEVLTFRDTMVRELTIYADIIGINSASALVFNDPVSAEGTLKPLREKRNIVSAGIYERNGQIFAEYSKDNGIKALRAPQNLQDRTDGHHFEGANLVLFKRIISEGERIGMVYIKSDLSEMEIRLSRYAGIVVGVFILSLLAAYVISSKLQQMISQPILHLATIARSISNEKNYAVRATVESQDEIGTLVETFNEMLNQIQSRNTALLKARDELEQKVEERTRDLVQENAQRKLAEEKLQQSMQGLKRVNTELQQFAYVASHDLQEPLRMVASFSQLLEMRYKNRLDKDADEFIEFIVGGANRMQRLINDLLSYSRVGTRGKPFQPTDFSSVLGQVLVNLGPLIEEKEAIVTNDDLPVLMADETQILQLFQNLIGNAIKFRGTERPVIHITARREASEWIFSVCDNGIGISPEYHERIFEIFQRLHTKEEYPGTGIGLAICKKIVERHSGRIWVESEPGKGSKFFFTISLQGDDL